MHFGSFCIFGVLYLRIFTAAAKQLDYLKIQFNENGIYSKRCAEHPSEIKSNEVIRVNCESITEPQQNIQINAHVDRGIDLAEIEIHSFAIEFPTLKFALLYRGCYDSISSTESKKMSFMECQIRCVEENYLFMGYQANKFCKCAVVPAGKQHHAGMCNWNCTDNPSRYCGGMGNNYLSVYLVRAPLPYFHGCFEVDPVTQDYHLENVTRTDDTQTHISCISFCGRQRYALLKDGNKCYCREERPNGGLRVPSGRCDTKCAGDDTALCGSAGHISIFSTCSQGKTSAPCGTIFRCEGRLSALGECDKCFKGYVGVYCLEFADFSEVKFEPTIEMLETTTLSAREAGWSIWKLLLLLATAASVGYPSYMMWKKRNQGESGGSSAASAKIPASIDE